jgi:hypothetical protein
MKKSIIAAAILVTSALAALDAGANAASPADWTVTLDHPCRRCLPAETVRKDAPTPIPNRAVIYSFTGEFAHRATWWLINLDTGKVTNRESVSKAGKWETTTGNFGVLNPDALAAIRAAAAAVWRSEPFKTLELIPGADVEDFVISGSRQVAFRRFTPRDHQIVAAIEAALPPDATTTNGSFVIPPQH